LTGSTADRGNLANLPRRVEQFVPSYVPHDAISNHVRQLRRALREAGHETEVFYEFVAPGLADDGRPYLESDPAPDPDRLILYHASTDSAMAPWLVSVSARGQVVAVDYHNITPARYFALWEPTAARSMERARQQLAALVPAASAAVADSPYNEQELIALGHPATAVAPLLFDLSEYHQDPDPAALARLRGKGSGPLLLFVGRLAPNKCQHDVIAAFAAYRRLFAPGARLALVGGATSPRYMRSLEAMISELDLDGSVELAGSAPFPELLAYYRAADLFVCLSEHEGFCIPVIEAMELEVPVLAYRAAALTDTVGEAGVLVEDKDPLTVAVAMNEVLSEGGRRAGLIEAGRRRAAEFDLALTAPLFLATLADVVCPRVPTQDRGQICGPV
jgi:glycosyltransferase involved in cell wall biosynthesis